MFLLRKYYKMCDELHEAVKNYDELLWSHRQRFLNGLPACDKELHILTFDVLHCFWGYKDAKQVALQEYEDYLGLQHIESLEEEMYDIDEKIRIIAK